MKKEKNVPMTIETMAATPTEGGRIDLAQFKL